MTTYLDTTRVYITIPWYTAVLIWAENSTKILAIWDYMFILTRQNLVITWNITCKKLPVKEYFVSENTLYRCFNGFNKIEYLFLTTNNMGYLFSAVIKTSIFWLESMKQTMILCESDYYMCRNIFRCKNQNKNFRSCVLDRFHIFSEIE